MKKKYINLLMKNLKLIKKSFKLLNHTFIFNQVPLSGGYRIFVRLSYVNNNGWSSINDTTKTHRIHI